MVCTFKWLHLFALSIKPYKCYFTITSPTPRCDLNRNRFICDVLIKLPWDFYKEKNCTAVNKKPLCSLNICQPISCNQENLTLCDKPLFFSSYRKTKPCETMQKAEDKLKTCLKCLPKSEPERAFMEQKQQILQFILKTAVFPGFLKYLA